MSGDRCRPARAGPGPAGPQLPSAGPSAGQRALRQRGGGAVRNTQRAARRVGHHGRRPDFAGLRLCPAADGPRSAGMQLARAGGGAAGRRRGARGLGAEPHRRRVFRPRQPGPGLRDHVPGARDRARPRQAARRLGTGLPCARTGVLLPQQPRLLLAVPADPGNPPGRRRPVAARAGRSLSAGRSGDGGGTLGQQPVSGGGGGVQSGRGDAEPGRLRRRRTADRRVRRALTPPWLHGPGPAGRHATRPAAEGEGRYHRRDGGADRPARAHGASLGQDRGPAAKAAPPADPGALRDAQSQRSVRAGAGLSGAARRAGAACRTRHDGAADRGDPDPPGRRAGARAPNTRCWTRSASATARASWSASSSACTSMPPRSIAPPTRTS